MTTHKSVKLFSHFVIFFVLWFSHIASASAYSLDQMAAAMNVLRVEMDGEKVCGIDTKILNRVPQLLQARIDGLKAPKLAYLENCESRCRCGFYADWLKAHDEKNPELVKLESRVKPVSAKQLEACARKNIWFCESSLLKELKKEADF